ncbi:hypothetical protein ACFIOY_36870 [Bradyrhizobium sp. TZ2]
MVIGNDKLKNAASSVAAAATPLAGAGKRGQRAAASTFGGSYDSVHDTSRMQDEASRGFHEGLRHARRAASDAMSGRADTFSDRFDEGAAGAREMWNLLSDAMPRKETLAQAQSSLSDLIERQPLVLGAVGLAIGAAVAGALTKSSLEDEWIGEASDSLKVDLSARAGAVSQSVGEASDTMNAELGDAGAEFVDRVKQAGRDAMDSAQAKIRS